MSTEPLKQIWEKWEIGYMLLYSLGVQVILTFLAPLRKRSASKLLRLALWLAYLSADAIAVSTISLIALRRYGESDETNNLITFWAPFLILHLGGPDSITAVQYEDNELWDRHALYLATKVGVTFFVIARSFRRQSVLLLLATFLVFLYAFIKCIERILALSSATIKTLRNSDETEPEPGLDYPCMMLEYTSGVNASFPTEIKGEEAPMVEPGTGVTNSYQDTDEMMTIKNAYDFYEKFKGIIADSFLSSKDVYDSREFYLSKQPLEAFRLVQIELNFMYDLFYTKAILLQKRGVGYARVICFISIVTSLLIFFSIDKNNYQQTDVMITYILLVGAVALEVSSMLMFLMSDWWVVTAYSKEIPKLLSSLMFLLLKWSKRARGLSRSIWSESIPQYNLLQRCVKTNKRFYKDPPSSRGSIFYLEGPSSQGIVLNKDRLIGRLFVDKARLDDQLVEFLVLELQTKARLANGDVSLINDICSARGNLMFQEKYSLAAEYLRPWTLDIDYDESLLTWHFATEICYQTCTNKDDKYVKFSKTLSDYMAYIIFHQPELCSAFVGASHILFDDTRAQVMKLIAEQYENLGHRVKTKILLDQFCTKVLQVETTDDDESRSVLFGSCCLAKKLEMFGQYQWEMTSKVWVELLLYAAIRSSPTDHVVLLSKGGELITSVWLLMAHLGLGVGLNLSKGFSWTKLIISTI